MKILIIAIALIFTTPSLATQIVIDKKTQKMYVDSPEGMFTWNVSTAKKGHYTPNGTFTPYSLQVMHYSKKYGNSPMPHSIFFYGDYAIHGTYNTNDLGRPSSHGCIRLSPSNAERLYGIVQRDRTNTIIHIQ